jgi:L-ribulose-5-phosphate 3-epimerase
MNPIGIMQGRLSFSRQLQVFPWTSWEDEFGLAAAIGLDLIEWLFDEPSHEDNPLWSAEGRLKIRQLMARTGVGVRSVCAHYFIGGQLSALDASTRAGARRVLEQLIDAAANIGAGTIVLPLAEGASLGDPAARDRALDVIGAAANRSANVRLALELDLDADGTLDVLHRLDHDAIGVCYDLGNATAAGLDPSEELERLRDHLYEVHIKDRKIGGPNVLLGRGSVDFGAAARALRALRYSGALVMETPRGEDPAATAAGHLAFVRQSLLVPTGNAR